MDFKVSLPIRLLIMSRKYVNGTNIIYELRHLMVRLGFLKHNHWLNHKEFYHGLKAFYGEAKCKKEYK